MSTPGQSHTERPNVRVGRSKTRHILLNSAKARYRTDVPEVRNRFLLSLGADRLEQLEIEPYQRRRRDRPIYREGDLITDLIFLDSGLCSALSHVPGEGLVEAWTFGGRRGVIGTHTLFLVRPESFFEYRVRLDLTGWKISRTALLAAMAADPAIDAQMREIYRITNYGVTKLNGCRAIHSAEQRFCRSLLTIRESLGNTDKINLSLTVLLHMVPISRSYWYNKERGLAEALAGIVTFKQRSLEIHDHVALEKLACPCYHEIIRERAKVIGEP